MFCNGFLASTLLWFRLVWDGRGGDRWERRGEAPALVPGPTVLGIT